VNRLDAFQLRRYPNFRNVTSSQEKGCLVVEVSPVSNYWSYACGLLLTSVMFLWISWSFANALLREASRFDWLTVALCSFLLVAFLVLWFVVGARIILKRLSSIEISVGNGEFKWTQRTFCWTKLVSVREGSVTAVVADARWYRKALKLKIDGQIYVLDDLLKEDLELLARQLRERLGVASL